MARNREPQAVTWGEGQRVNSKQNIPSEDHQVKSKLTLFDSEVFRTFVSPGEVVEARILHGKNKVDSGYFDDHESLCKAVKVADKQPHAGIYFTLQIIDPRLLARAFNRIKPQATLTTSDLNVIAYRWLPIDLDPVRPAGIGSSDPELTEALKLRDIVAEWVMSEFKFSKPIRAMSGNGGHLLFRLPDLPVNEENKGFIKNILEGLAARFNTDRVTIDITVHNPSRIWKLYGTTAQKGDSLPAGPYRGGRPHRMAYIDDMGGQG